MQIGFILVYPAEALKAAREGLNLWLNVMIPKLLPFLILTGILVQTDQISRLLAPLKKLWKIVLGISPAGAYAVLVGMLCGYPMGAKTTSAYLCESAKPGICSYISVSDLSEWQCSILQNVVDSSCV